MKVRRSPASFPRGRGTAVGAKADHLESGAQMIRWGQRQRPDPLFALPEVKEEIP